MEIRPILSSLKRNPVAATLIAAQIALTLAILANVLFIVSERIEAMALASGVDEPNVFLFHNQNIGQARPDEQATDQDLATVRAIPGVLAVTPTFSIPMGRSGWNTSVGLKAEDKADGADRSAAMYMGDEQFLEALGSRVIEGRMFEPGEITPFKQGDQPNPSVVLVSKGLAEKLFPGESAIGKMINITGDRGQPQQRIIGVTDHLATPWPRSRNPDRAILAPYKLVGSSGFIVRTQPGERDRVMSQVEEKLFAVERNRIIPSIRGFDEIRTEAYRNDRAMAVLLAVIGIALLAVTAFGIVGQASFWVTQRTRQIGTRRALGARQRDIVRYFQTENALIALIGIAAGSALALGINVALVQYLGFDKLPWTWLPVGAVVVLIIGQLAVLGPALRASRIAPAIATRSA
ncbi:MAG: ABC transporter permease [Lysobacterales bacterium]